MKIRHAARYWACAALAFAGFAAAPVQAAPVEASVDVSGTPGFWVATFTFTNNLSTDTSLFLLGANGNGFARRPPNPFVWAWGGPIRTTIDGEALVYGAAWLDNSADLSGIEQGETLSGFQATFGQLEAPTEFDWIVYVRGAPVTDQFDFNFGENRGFRGHISLAAPVPEPAMALLTLAALPLIGAGVARQRRRRV